MESVRIKGNARKSTYSGKPTGSAKPRASIQEQRRLRQALEPESNVNHVPAKSFPTTWKRSGWSLSARVRHSSREEAMDGLLTPMEVNKDKVANDPRPESGNAENVAGGEKKSPDERSLWSLFSAPKLQERPDENKSRVYGISNGTSKRQELTPHQATLTRDQSCRKQEDKGSTERTPTPSFNLLSKMKPFKKNVSRNFFAQLGTKPDVAVSQEKAVASEEKATTDTAKHTKNVAAVPQSTRLPTSTKDLSRKKSSDSHRKGSTDSTGSQEKPHKRRLSLREQVTAHSGKKVEVSVNHDAAVVSDKNKDSVDTSNISEEFPSKVSNCRLHSDDRTSDLSSKTASIEARIEGAENADSDEQHPKRRLGLREQAAAHLKRTCASDKPAPVSLKTSTDKRTDKNKDSQNFSTKACNKSIDDRTDISRKNILDNRTEGKETHTHHPNRRRSLREQVTAFSNKGQTNKSTKDTKDTSGKVKHLAMKSADIKEDDNSQRFTRSGDKRPAFSDSAEYIRRRQKQGRTSSVKEKLKSELVLMAKDADVSEKTDAETPKHGMSVSPVSEEAKDKTTFITKKTEESDIDDLARLNQGRISPVFDETKNKTGLKDNLDSETVSLAKDEAVLKEVEAERQKQVIIYPVSEKTTNKTTAIAKQTEKSDVAVPAQLKKGRTSRTSEAAKSDTIVVKDKLESETVLLAKNEDVPERTGTESQRLGRISPVSGEAEDKSEVVGKQAEKLDINDPTRQKQDRDSPVQKEVTSKIATFIKQAGEPDKSDPGGRHQRSVFPRLEDTAETSSQVKQAEELGESTSSSQKQDLKKLNDVVDGTVIHRNEAEESNKSDISKQNQSRSSPKSYQITNLPSILSKQDEADKALAMPTVTLPSNIQYPRTTSNISSEADEDESLFIDENARADQSSDDEDLGKDEDDESHVLRVWSLQSEEETSSDFLNLSGVDAESSLGLDTYSPSPLGPHVDATQTLDDSFASAVIESLSSLDVSNTEDNTDSKEKLDEDLASDDLLKSGKEKSETPDAQHVKESKIRGNSDDDPPMLQAQPNTHHLLQELDSLLECSTYKNETHVNVSHEASKEMPVIDTSDHSTNDQNMCNEHENDTEPGLDTSNLSTNDQSVCKESESNGEQEPARNIFSLFGSGKRSPAMNIVKLNLGNNAKQSNGSSYRSAISKDSIVLSGSCSGERDSLTNEDRNVNTSSNDKSTEILLTNKSLESGVTKMSCFKPLVTGPSTSSDKSSEVLNCSSCDKSFEAGGLTRMNIHSPETDPCALSPDKSPECEKPVSSSMSLDTGLASLSRDTLLPNSGSKTSSNEPDADIDLPTNSLDATSVMTIPALESSDASLATLSGITSPDNRIPSLTLEIDEEGDEDVNDISLSSQPPELSLEVPSAPTFDKVSQSKSPSPPVPEEEKMDDIHFLAFESRDDLFSYSKSLKLKFQRRGVQATKAPAKKVIYPVVKNVKMKRRRPSPLAAKVKALEQDLLMSMKSKGITEIVHPSLCRKGISLDRVKKNNLFVHVRTEEIERTSHRRSKHKKQHRPRTEVSPTSGARWQGKELNSVEVLGSKLLGRYLSNSSIGSANEREQTGKSSVVGLKHGPATEKHISTSHSSELAVTNAKKSKPRHSASHQEWAICQEGPKETSEKPSLKLKFISKPKTIPIEQSPFALSTKPKESAVPLKSPTSHIPVNVQQLHVPSSSAASKSIALVVPKNVEEKQKPTNETSKSAEEKPPPSTRLPEEESLPFKPFEKPVASKKSAFVSDALEDLLQGEDIDNKVKSLISPSTISVTNARVVYKVPSQQSHTVKTLDMALKRLKPLNVSSPSFKEKLEAQHRSEKKKKKKKHKHKDRTKEKIKKDFVFGSGPDDLVRKLPKLPFASYGRTFARPLFAREKPVSKTVGEKSTGFLTVRNVLSISDNATEKRQLEEGGMQPEKKIKQEPIESDEKLPPVISKSILNINEKILNLFENGRMECKESLTEEGHASPEKEMKKCPDFCRLGCICNSLNDSRPLRERTGHCRKIDCMFGCICNKNSSQIVTGTRNRRPPTFPQDMFFYDDSHKFWRTGDIGSLTTDTKKLQLLDHLPASEKRTLVNTCARTRLFETDKPDRWLKWKRIRQGGPVKPSKEKKQAADSVVATSEASKDSYSIKTQGLQIKPDSSIPMASLPSTVPSIIKIQGPQTQTNVDSKQQKQPRKGQHFIKLSVPGDVKKQGKLSLPSSKPDNPVSRVENAPLVNASNLQSMRNQGTEGISQVLSTFIPVAKQYLLNGTLMNMVVLPNGDRVLLPVRSCPPYTIHRVIDKPVTSYAAESKAPTPNVDSVKSKAIQNSVASTQPRANPSGPHQTQPSAQVSANANHAPVVLAACQRPALPIRYTITSSGIKVTPGVGGMASAQVSTGESSNFSHGTLNLVPQASLQSNQIAGSAEKCNPATAVSQSVPKTLTASKAIDPKVNPSTKKNAVDSQSSVQRATSIDTTKAKTVARSDENVQNTINPPSAKKNIADSEPSIQGGTLTEPAMTETFAKPTHDEQKKASSSDVKKDSPVKPSDQSCSSEITSHESNNELYPETTKVIQGLYGNTILIKTFVLNVDGSQAYIILSIYTDGKWTKLLEQDVKQEITKFIKDKKPVGYVKSLGDMNLKLESWDTRRYCVSVRLKSIETVEQFSNKAKSSCGDKENIQHVDHVSGSQMNEGNKAVGGHSDTTKQSAKENELTQPPTELNPDAPLKKLPSHIDLPKTDQVYSCDADGQYRSQQSNIKTQPKTVGLTAATSERKPADSFISKGGSSSDSREDNIRTEDPSKEPKHQVLTPKGKPIDSNHLKRALSESRTETSTKLSSSLPEFEKLSAIVKRNSFEDDDTGLSPVKKISKSAMEWLNDPKILKSSDYQNYSGVRGPWFTKEKEGVKVVLQGKKQKKISSKRSSSVLIVSPKKSMKTDCATTHTAKDSDSISLEDRSISDIEDDIFGTEDTEKLDAPGESAQESEEGVSSDDEVIAGSRNERKTVHSEANSDQIYLDASSGIFVSKDHVSPNSKLSDDHPNINASKDSRETEEAMIGGRSDQHSSSSGSTAPKTSAKWTDARSQNGVEADKDSTKEDEGCLDIGHFARFSEEDAYGSMDFDDIVSDSFDLPSTFYDDDDSSSVASLRIDESIIGDERNSDMEKSKSLLNDEEKLSDNLPSCKIDSPTAGNTRNISSHQSLGTDISPTETTPVKNKDALPKKSPILNIKFVATSNENCTSPICFSPLSEVPTEYSQERSISPARSPITIGSIDPSESALSDIEQIPENLDESPTGLVEAKDQLNEDLSVCKKIEERSATSGNFNDQSDDALCAKNSQDESQVALKSRVTSEAALPDAVNSNEDLPATIKSIDSPTDAHGEEKKQDGLPSTLKPDEGSDGTLYPIENIQNTFPIPGEPNDTSVVTTNKVSEDSSPALVALRDQSDSPTDALSVALSEAHSEKKKQDELPSTLKSNERSDGASIENIQDTVPIPGEPNDSSLVTTNKVSEDSSSTLVASRDQSEMDLTCTEILPIASPIPVTSHDQSEQATIFPENSEMKLPALSQKAPTCSEDLPAISTAQVASNGQSDSPRIYTEVLTHTSPIPARSSNPPQSWSDTEVDVVNTDDDDDEIDVETVLGTTISTAHVLNPYSSLRDITSRLSSALKKEEEQKVRNSKKITPKPSGPSKTLITQNPLAAASEEVSKIKRQSDGQSLTTQLKKKKEKTKRKSPLCPSKQWDSPQFRVVYEKSSPSEETKDEELTRVKLHNFLERRRRDDLRKSFDKLRSELSDLTEERIYPKIMILRKAREKARELREEEEELVKVKKLLKDHQRRLVYVHSNLLHHARCSGQISFPEGSRLAESMERVRLGIGKHFSTSPAEDEDAGDPSLLPQDKGKKRKADHHSRIDYSAPEGRSHLVFKKKKKKKRKSKSESLDLVPEKSTSSSNTASNESFKSLNVSKMTSMERNLGYNIETERVSMGNASDLPSACVSGNVRRESPFVLGGCESSGDEESLPIECYVSSSDEPQEQDDADFGMDEDDEQYSDDGFIPASDDENIANVENVGRSSDDNKGDKSDRQTADIGLLDSFQPVKVLPGSCRVTQRNLIPRRKEVISLDSTDSDDDVLVIDESRGSGKSKKKKDRTKLGSHGDRNKNSKQIGAQKLPRMDKSSRIFHSIPSEVSSVAESSSSRTGVETKASEKVAGEKQSKAPLVDVINEIMNRLRGDTSAESSAGEEKISEVTGPGRAQSKVIDSRSNDRQERQKATSPPIASAGIATDNIKSIVEEQAPTTLEVEKHDLLSKQASSGAAVGHSGMRDKSQSTCLSNSTLDGEDRTTTQITSGNAHSEEASSLITTFTNKAMKQENASISSHAASNSIKDKEKLQKAPTLKLIKDEEQVMSGPSKSKFTEKVDKQMSMTTPTATSSTISQSSDLSLKDKMEEIMKKGLGRFDELSDDSDLDSPIEGEQELSTSTSHTKDTTDISISTKAGGEKNDMLLSEKYPVKTCEKRTGVLPIKDTGNSSSDSQIVRKEKSDMTPQSVTKDTKVASMQKNNSDLKMEGPLAYTNQMRRVSADQEDVQEKSPAVPLPKDSAAAVSLSKDTNAVSSSKDTVTALPKKGALADLISSMKTRVGNEDASDVMDGSESEDEVDSDDDDDDVVSNEDSNDEETSDDGGEEVEDNNAREVDNPIMDGGSKKQNAIFTDAADIKESTAGKSEISTDKIDENKKLDSSESTDRTNLSTTVGQKKDSSERFASSSVCKMESPSHSTKEKYQDPDNQGQIGDSSDGLPFTPNELQVGFSADEVISDDDAACLSYAAMGNDEDNEALFDAEDCDSPFSPLSLDMNIASNDDVVILDDEPKASGSEPVEASPSVAGTSTGDIRQRPAKTSPRAELSPGGYLKPSASSRQDLTLDEAISFLNIEKNSDGTVNVFLKGDYDDEMLDELFKKPGVMDYIIKTVAKK